MTVPGPDNAATRTSGPPIADGARAAGLLEAAVRSAPSTEDSLQLETIRDLARDLGRQLDALDRLSREGDGPEVLVEAALRCADLATLAACAVPYLPADDARGFPLGLPAQATRLAADAVRTLASSVGDGGPDGGYGENLIRDMRSAAWRADLATRQVAGPAQGGSS